jgi:hypothetical protein
MPPGEVSSSTDRIGRRRLVSTGSPPGEQLPIATRVRRAFANSGIGRGEGEQVAHLAPGHVDHAETLALADQHGPPLTGRHP